MSFHQNEQRLDDVHVMADSPVSFDLPPNLFHTGQSVYVFVKPQNPKANYQIHAWQVLTGSARATEVYREGIKPGQYTVTLADSDTLFMGPDASFNLTVHEPGIISAGSGHDDVHGGVGNDTLNGGSGDDHLAGGAGRDVLRGETGLDTFVFDTIPKSSLNTDAIADFSIRDDTIQLDHTVFKKLGSKTGTLKKDYFTIGSKAKDKNDYVIYDKTKGVLSYDQDGSGSKKAIDIATLDKKLKMTHKDFFVV